MLPWLKSLILFLLGTLPHPPVHRFPNVRNLCERSCDPDGRNCCLGPGGRKSRVHRCSQLNEFMEVRWSNVRTHGSTARPSEYVFFDRLKHRNILKPNGPTSHWSGILEVGKGCAHVRAKRNIKKHGYYCRFRALGSVSGFSFSRSVGFSYFEEGICHAQPKNDFVAEDLTNNHLTYAAPIVN